MHIMNRESKKKLVTKWNFRFFLLLSLRPYNMDCASKHYIARIIHFSLDFFRVPVATEIILLSIVCASTSEAARRRWLTSKIRTFFLVTCMIFIFTCVVHVHWAYVYIFRFQCFKCFWIMKIMCAAENNYAPLIMGKSRKTNTHM